MMSKLLGLALLGSLFLLTGCIEVFSPCASPGGMSVPPSSWDKTQRLGGTAMNCLYGFDIKSIDAATGEVKATVAEAELERNRSRKNDYFGRQLFSSSWYTNFNLEDVPRHIYTVKVDKNDLNRFKEGDKDVTFEGELGTNVLKFCDDTCLNKRETQCREYYKSKPEDNKCGEKQSRS
jgi:hypothetical protein